MNTCEDCNGVGCAVCEHTGKRYPTDKLMSAFWQGFWEGYIKTTLILSPVWLVVLIWVIWSIT